MNNKYILFISSTCNKCPSFKNSLTIKDYIEYTEKDKEIINKYNIFSSPTLIVLDNNSNEIIRINDEYELLQWQKNQNNL